MKMVILLTGCIDPNGMAYTALNSIEERKTQYVNAIQFYLKETSYPIVFCENSGTDISYLFQNHINSGRLECLSFYGNQNKEKGKGYGEAEIIEYTLNHSRLICDNCIITKITGRLIINNICNILSPLKKQDNFVSCLFHSDLKFADSRLICAATGFYTEFLKNKDQINDNNGVYFEHILSSSVINSNMRYIPFPEEPMIIGTSGTTGDIYQTHKRTFKSFLLFKCYSLSQVIRINSISSHQKYDICETLLIRIRIFLYKTVLYFI